MPSFGYNIGLGASETGILPYSPAAARFDEGVGLGTELANSEMGGFVGPGGFGGPEFGEGFGGPGEFGSPGWGGGFGGPGGFGGFGGPVPPGLAFAEGQDAAAFQAGEASLGGRGYPLLGPGLC